MKRAFPQAKLATLVISQAIILMMMPAHAHEKQNVPHCGMTQVRSFLRERRASTGAWDALTQMWLCHFA